MNRLALWGLAALIGGAATASAHPRHVSIAEAEFNRESGHFEVALRVRPEDLEQALARTGPRVVLEKTPDVDKRITAYLKRHFSLRNGGAVQELEWVGNLGRLYYSYRRIYLCDVPTGTYLSTFNSSKARQLLHFGHTVLRKMKMG